MNLFYDFNRLFILNSVPKPIARNYNEIMIFNIKTCDFRLTNYNFWTWLFCLEITKSSCGRKSPWEHSQRTDNLVVISSIRLSNGCCLVDFSTSCNDSLLLIRIWRLMVLADLIKLFTILTGQNSSWISQVCHITCVLINEINQSTWSTVITFLFPFFFCH